MKFTVHGPYKLRRQGNKLVDKSSKARKTFWDAVEEDEQSLAGGCGCYIFAIKAAKGVTTWYVGQASKQSFERECFSAHKVNIYNDAVADRKGTPQLFLIARRTSGCRLAKPSPNGHKDVSFLETVLIGTALDRNSELMNVKKTKMLRNIEVPGVLNTPPGKPPDAVRSLRKALYG